MNNKPEKGKVWHQALTTPQSLQIRKIHAILGKELLGEFEHFEAEFLKRLYLDWEIARYERIAKAFAVWKEENPDADFNVQKLAFEQRVACTPDLNSEGTRYLKKNK